MKHDEFEAAIRRLFGSVAAGARELDINPRTMRKYCADPATVSATNALTVPASLAAEVREMLDRFPNGVRMIDPRHVLCTLLRQMIDAGWNDGQAAAAILGAAHGLSIDALGGDEVSRILANTNDR